MSASFCPMAVLIASRQQAVCCFSLPSIFYWKSMPFPEPFFDESRTIALHWFQTPPDTRTISRQGAIKGYTITWNSLSFLGYVCTIGNFQAVYLCPPRLLHSIHPPCFLHILSGAVYLVNAMVKFKGKNLDFWYNNALEGSGGAVYVGSVSRLRIKDVVFFGNVRMKTRHISQAVRNTVDNMPLFHAKLIPIKDSAFIDSAFISSLNAFCV